MANEQVLAVPTERLNEIGRFAGFSRSFDGAAAFTHATFVDRAAAEVDESWRQIIPYVVVVCPNGVLSYRRASAGGEARLHGLRSIGIGGHVNPSDLEDGLGALRAAPIETLARAAARETREETRGVDDTPLTWIGFIREDTSAVARVHFGVVYAANTADEAELSDEGKMIDAEYASWSELSARLAEFEGWSRHVIRAMAEA